MPVEPAPEGGLGGHLLVEGSDGIARPVSHQALLRLMALIDTLQVEPEDLDDLVHDCFERTASATLNADPETVNTVLGRAASHPLDVVEDGDALYESFSRTASVVNNSGVRAQAALLLADLGEVGASDAVREL